jgi:uncharacterized protein (DUF2267 family)
VNWLHYITSRVTLARIFARQEGTPMSKENAKTFLERLGKEENLRKRVNAAKCIADAAKAVDPKLDFSVEELDEVLHEKWGSEIYSTYIQRLCFSEVPGF